MLMMAMVFCEDLHVPQPMLVAIAGSTCWPSMCFLLPGKNIETTKICHKGIVLLEVPKSKWGKQVCYAVAAPTWYIYYENISLSRKEYLLLMSKTFTPGVIRLRRYWLPLPVDQRKIFTLRDAFPFQNRWIFGKVPNSLWPPPSPSFSESYIANFLNLYQFHGQIALLKGPNFAI